MTSASPEFVALLAAALAGGLITKIAQSIWKRVHPSISVDLGTRTLKILNEIRTLFGEGSAIGGHLEYPWIIRGEILREDNLRFELEAAIVTVGDRKFEDSVEVIKKQLRILFATAYSPSEGYRTFQRTPFAGKNWPDPTQIQAESESLEKFATLQGDAIDRGMISLEIAVSRIHKLLRRNR